MDILTFFDIFLKPPQPFTGLFFTIVVVDFSVNSVDIM